MQNQLFADIPLSERKRYLSDNCDRVEELEYLKPYESDDLNQLKDSYTDVSIQIAKLEAEKKKLTDEFNKTLKELKGKAGITLLYLRNKAEQVTEPCYMFFDTEAKIVGYYNAEGRLVSSRPMRPGENQQTVFGLTRGDEFKTGTND
ncbi:MULTISPECIES: hypothetical protein [unclassified Spirosoma]|mgnify:CR=1 FL=1|uniref:hypothetical protein n=1 Tax=unclassified Spirosoma TaxID=2621999 RepID=UPI000963EC13|nr:MULTISPECIES: hypothetical protein [unclassified Spirosoma]MBN8821308.1 hypothetical protein [Spirosoma sp.]OJW78097.1 MAG: hypothetical protein BGO59_29195 [Spirosoma sp. 48-14]